VSYDEANTKLPRRMSVTSDAGVEWGFTRLDVANPSGVVAGNPGDVARATTGVLYECVGGTAWIAVVSGVFAGLVVVDPTNAAADDTPDKSTPFVTIQGALDAIGAPVDAADQKARWTVQIVSGEYDEDLTIPAGRRIVLLPLGPVTLGDGAGPDYESTTPRSITFDATPAFGQRVTFGIGTIIPTCVHAVRCTQATAFDVSGDLVLVGTPTVPEAAAVRVSMTRVRGDVDGTALAALGVDLHFDRSRVDGDVNGAANTVIVHAESAAFQGTITTVAICHVTACNLDGDVTVTQPPTFGGAAVLPPGFYSCRFDGTHTFTGPAGSLYLDAASNYWIKANAWVLGGGATKTIIGDLTP